MSGIGIGAADLAKIVESVTGLAWCGLAALVLMKLLPSVRDALAKRRVTVKVAGMELSFQETAEQVEKQLEAIRTLGERVDHLEEQFASLRGSPSATMHRRSQRPPAAPSRVHQILWVDDSPQNNAYEIAALEGAGVRIVLATSTDEAMRALDKSTFSVVITDMTREEGGKRVTDAGAKLIKRMRAEKLQTPVVVYTTRRKAEDWEEELTASGALLIWSQLDLLLAVARQLRETDQRTT